ncbi:MAG: globin-coupled sensor protein [Oceanicaulis sp.]|nr:globin-coupled sensor protein [Oceanicaulis sp.]
MNKDDLVTRFEFLDFTSEDRACLKAVKPVVDAALPDILDSFYADIARHETVSVLFKDEAMRVHARQKQIEHWSLICGARFDADYLASVKRIGEAHARLGLAPEWYFGGYAKLVSGLIKAITDAHLSRTVMFGTGKVRQSLAGDLDTVIKAAMLDMDLCISTIEACAEQDKQAERERLADEFQQTVSAIVEEVASASGKLADTARALSGTADATSEKSATVAAAAEQATVTAQTVASAAHQLTGAITEIASRATEAASGAATAQSRAQETGHTMSQLEQAAEKIGEIVNLIESVAEQTNLLALNATIEAARAGEAGKGFAVVASEVKSLAAQTAKATEDISSQIAHVQGAVREAVTAIGEVSGAIEQVNGVSASISAAVEEQNAATAEISRNTTQTAESTGSVSETISDVLAGARQTSETAGVLVEASEELGRQAADMRQNVDRFLAHIRAA